MAIVFPVTPPNLPLAPDKYSNSYHNQVNNVLRLFMSAASNAINADIVAESAAAKLVAQKAGTLDLSAFTNFNVNVQKLTANITSIVFPAAVDDGTILYLRFQQASTGGPFTVAGWPTKVKLAGGAYTMTATASKYDLLTFHYDKDLNFWFEQSRSQSM